VPGVSGTGTAACGDIKLCAETAAGAKHVSAATNSRRLQNDAKPRPDMPFSQA
jgi:hypothetical protein